MPRLVEKSDGTYIVRHYYRQNSTWQIDADGVRFLKRCGVRPEELFDTTLFMELWSRGMVYTGARRPKPAGPQNDGPRLPDDLALRERVARLYQELYLQNLDDAYTYLHPAIRAAKTLAQFKTRLTGTRRSRLASWKIHSFGSLPSQGVAPSGPTRIGWVIVDLEIQDESGARHKLSDLRENWSQMEREWYWIWWGWQDENAAHKV
jgi:hypothetical protein